VYLKQRAAAISRIDMDTQLNTVINKVLVENIEGSSIKRIVTFAIVTSSHTYSLLIAYYTNVQLRI